MNRNAYCISLSDKLGWICVDMQSNFYFTDIDSLSMFINSILGRCICRLKLFQFSEVTIAIAMKL